MTLQPLIHRGRKGSYETFEVGSTLDMRGSLIVKDAGTLYFGDDNDVALSWDGSQLEFLPVTDGVGSVNIGDGTSDMNFKVFLGDVNNYALFNVADQKIYIFGVPVGENRRTLHLDMEPTGAEMRRGAITIDIWRSDDFAWAGSPDAGIKISVDNAADNSDASGAIRSIDTTARNRGNDINWVHGIHAGVRNDSGSNCYEIVGFSTRVENYGVMNTQCMGIDVNLSIESDDGAGSKTGILVRNTDQSAQTAVDEVIKISHTSTNGFEHLINFAGASGESIASGSLKNSDESDIKADARIKIVWNTNTYYLPAYNTVV